MNGIVLLIALATPASGPADAAVQAALVEHPLSSPSTWAVDRLAELGGRLEKRRGSLKLEKGACGVLDVFPSTPWTIIASRITGDHESGKFEWDIEWANEFGPGNATVRGIYRVRGDRLWLCFTSRRNDETPTDFTTKLYNGRTVLVLRRVK